MLIGLGARDSLRLEAGMCLYGHDLDESVSPVEGGLSWVIGTFPFSGFSIHSIRRLRLPSNTTLGKDRRASDAQPSFPGKSRILEELANGPSRRRVGFEIIGAPAREGCKVLDALGGKEIGQCRFCFCSSLHS